MAKNPPPATPRVGGQAIIEGVMMRSPERVSAAVRLANGEIARQVWESRLWYKRHKLLGWPIVRGAVSLAESLVLGIRTLNWSAEVAMEQEKQESSPQQEKAGRSSAGKKRESWGLAITMIVAGILAVGLFMLFPYELANLLKTDKNQPLFHLVAGSTRILLFLLYLWAISRLKDVRRIFEYHGAEHQSIFSYEKGQALEPDTVGLQSRFHPRCGTSFLLIVAVIVMALFTLFDVLVTTWWGNYPNALVRLLVHLPFMPLVAGISYEFLRLSDRFGDRGIWRLLIAPGLSLQRLTTRPPDNDQREVALAALKSALKLDPNPVLPSCCSPKD